MTIRKNVHAIVMVALVIAFIFLIRPAVAEESPPQGGAPQATATQAPGPQPDPAGVATGGKADAIDGAGNAFVVTEPTDTKASDYAEKKKQYQEYKEQAAKEPLAVKLADTVGHVRIATNFNWTLITGYLFSLCKRALPFSPVGWCARRTPAIS